MRYLIHFDNWCFGVGYFVACEEVESNKTISEISTDFLIKYPKAKILNILKL